MKLKSVFFCKVRSRLTILFRKLKCLRGIVWETARFKKIDFLWSTWNVFFLKAYITFSNLANFQNFWTLPSWYTGVLSKFITTKIVIFWKSQLFTKNGPISSILDQILRFEKKFQRILYVLHESNNKSLENFIFSIQTKSEFAS